MPTNLPVDPPLRNILTNYGDSSTQLMFRDGQHPHEKRAAASLFPSEEKAIAMKEFAMTTPPPPSQPQHYDKEQIIGLYFTASWCPPCMRFTPQLKRAYASIRQDQGKDFEVLQVPWDQDEEQYKEYLENVPWPALPFNDRRIDELNRVYNVAAIPRLVLVRARDGKVINSEAQDYLASDVLGRADPWPPVKRSMLWNVMNVGTVGVLAWIAFVALRDLRYLRPKA